MLCRQKLTRDDSNTRYTLNSEVTCVPESPGLFHARYARRQTHMLLGMRAVKHTCPVALTSHIGSSPSASWQLPIRLMASGLSSKASLVSMLVTAPAILVTSLAAATTHPHAQHFTACWSRALGSLPSIRYSLAYSTRYATSFRAAQPFVPQRLYSTNLSTSRSSIN